MKYILKTKTEQPGFNFMVTRNGYFEYWLFNEFDDALSFAKTLQAKHPIGIILIYEPYFNTVTREWHAQNTFSVIDNRVYYDKTARALLHMKFYTDAGEWQNPDFEEET